VLEEVQPCFTQAWICTKISLFITTMDDKGQIVGQKKLPSSGEVIEFLKEFGENMEVAIEAAPS